MKRCNVYEKLKNQQKLLAKQEYSKSLAEMHVIHDCISF